MAELAPRRLFAFVFCFSLVSSPAAFAQDAEKLAVFNLRGQVTEKSQGDSFPFGPIGSQSLQELLTRMNKIPDDDQVKGVVLMLGDLSIGRAQTEELRQTLQKIRSSGKKVHAHTGSLSTGAYVLLSQADEISIVPTADLWLTGFYGESPYLRGLLDKIGVVPDYLTCGDYKSAAEMFMRKKPSSEAESMQNWLLDSIYESSVDMIAAGRNVDAATVRQWIDEGPYTAESAKEKGIVDAIQTLHAFEAGLKEKYGEKIQFDKRYGRRKQPDIDFNNPFAMLRIWSEILQGAQKRPAGKASVGIVYVDGPIMEGSPQQNPFAASGVAFSGPLLKALDEAADDDSIKAVVLRVNSPGGSAVASEIILQATKRVKEKKPLVVSMGDVAGSGGYYVACGADTIFADRLTITGSIGVVGGKFATTKMWDRIGVNFKSYKRGENAGILSSERPFNDAEREKIQGWMNEIYGVFKDHVVAIRGDRLKKEIDELAGGRVFTGAQALELGLVDKIGSLDDAIRYAAKQAEIEDYEIRAVPKPKNFLEALIEDLTDDNSDTDSLIRLAQGASVPSIVEMALPMLQHLDPQRIETIKTALLRLDLIQKERAVLMMPEIRIAN